MAKKKSIWFILNPISGTVGKEHILNDIKRLVDTSKFTYRIERTGYRGHASVLATMAAENGADIAVAIGGDGTVNEVARSLVHTETALGIIPCGSGNGLARHIQIPLDSEGAIRLINKCDIKALDYGKIDDKPFFCTCGLGFDAMISYKFAASIKRGILSYMENTLNYISRYKPETYVLQDEHKKLVYKAFLITCANASQYGNNAYIAPEASMSDGLMDITLVEPFTAIEAPQLAYQLFNGTLADGGKIRMFRARKLTITREREGVVHCDGEPFQAGKVVSIEIIPKKLNAIVNKESEGRSPSILQTMGEALGYMASSNPLAESLRQVAGDLRIKMPFKK